MIMLPQTSLLVVDDSPEDREAMTRALKKAGIATPIRYCVSGDDALKYLFRRGKYVDETQSPRPNVILLDLNMPGTDGRAVLSQIKQSDDLKSIPVIVLTTSADDRDIEACYRMGCNTYVKKPVNMDAFTVSVQRLKDYWFEVAILPKIG